MRAARRMLTAAFCFYTTNTIHSMTEKAGTVCVYWPSCRRWSFHEWTWDLTHGHVVRQRRTDGRDASSFLCMCRCDARWCAWHHVAAVHAPCPLRRSDPPSPSMHAYMLAIHPSPARTGSEWLYLYVWSTRTWSISDGYTVWYISSSSIGIHIHIYMPAAPGACSVREWFRVLFGSLSNLSYFV